MKDETVKLHRAGERKSAKERLLILQMLLSGGGRYAWHFLKNCVKVAIGRPSYFHDDDLFFRQYVFHLLGFRPLSAITCAGYTSEGPGSQAYMIMRAINFANATGLVYMHTPFESIPGADRPMHEWFPRGKTSSISVLVSPFAI